MLYLGPSGEVEKLAQASMEMVVEQLKRVVETLEAGPMVRSQDVRSAVNDLNILAEMAKQLFPTLPSAHRKEPTP